MLAVFQSCMNFHIGASFGSTFGTVCSFLAKHIQFYRDAVVCWECAGTKVDACLKSRLWNENYSFSSLPSYRVWQTGCVCVDLWSWRTAELGGSGAPTAGSSSHKAERKTKKIQCWLQLLLNSWVPVSAIPAAVITVFAPATFLAEHGYLSGRLGQTSPVGSHSLRCHSSWTRNVHKLETCFIFLLCNSISSLTEFMLHAVTLWSLLALRGHWIKQFSCILF